MKKGGDVRPLFSVARRASYRFLPPFFFAPLAAFFAIAWIPPLRCCASAGPHDTGASLPTGTPDLRVSRPRFVAGGARSRERGLTIDQLQTKKGARPAAAPFVGGACRVHAEPCHRDDWLTRTQ